MAGLFLLLATFVTRAIDLLLLMPENDLYSLWASFSFGKPMWFVYMALLVYHGNFRKYLKDEK